MFFKKNYLSKEQTLGMLNYYEQKDIFLKLTPDFYNIKESLLRLPKIKHEDIRNFIIATRTNCYTDFRKIIKKKINSKNNSDFLKTDIYFKNTLYIKPCLWDKNIVEKVKNTLDNMKKDYLILDLRGSSGGYLTSALGLCNFLLPKCEIVFIEYKKDKKSHYSDETYYKFKKIFIMIDKSTASSSEILAYSLYSNLNNVVLFGEKTYGKTFGQDYIVNKECNFEFIVPTFRWFIKDFSYQKVNINSTDSTFLSEIKILIDKNEGHTYE